MKDLLVAYLLWFFLGTFGAHRFYLEKPGTGILYLFTFGLFGIGWLVDFFTLPRQVRDANILLTHKYYRPELPIAKQPDKPKKLTDKDKDKIVLLTAKKYNGRITPMEIAADTDFSIDEAEAILKKFADKGYADVKVSNTGTIFYEFSGFLSDHDKSTGNTTF